jgi:hypothetical protein
MWLPYHIYKRTHACTHTYTMHVWKACVSAAEVQLLAPGRLQAPPCPLFVRDTPRQGLRSTASLGARGGAGRGRERADAVRLCRAATAAAAAAARAAPQARDRQGREEPETEEAAAEAAVGAGRLR